MKYPKFADPDVDEFPPRMPQGGEVPGGLILDSKHPLAPSKLRLSGHAARDFSRFDRPTPPRSSASEEWVFARYPSKCPKFTDRNVENLPHRMPLEREVPDGRIMDPNQFRALSKLRLSTQASGDCTASDILFSHGWRGARYGYAQRTRRVS